MPSFIALRSASFNFFAQSIVAVSHEGDVVARRHRLADIVQAGKIAAVEHGDGHVLHGRVEPALFDQLHDVDDFRIALQLDGFAELLST